MRQAARRASLSVLPLVLAAFGCGPAAVGSATPARPSATLPIAPATSPLNALTFPTAAARDLERARYSVSPPFDLPLTFEAPGEGWESWHLLGEFVDVVRWDGAARNTAPMRWIAFAHPTTIRGEADVPIAGLSPEEIAAELRDRDDLEVTEPEPFELAGLKGVRVDLHPDDANTVILGGPRGHFEMDTGRFGRLGIVVADGEPLLFFVSAPPDELEATWSEVQPVLESVELEP